jgi:hypothetical protein
MAPTVRILPKGRSISHLPDVFIAMSGIKEAMSVARAALARGDRVLGIHNDADELLFDEPALISRFSPGR